MLRPSAEEYAAYADDYAKYGATAQAGAPAGRPGDPEAADALQLVAQANHEEAQAAYAAQQNQLAVTSTAP